MKPKLWTLAIVVVIMLSALDIGSRVHGEPDTPNATASQPRQTESPTLEPITVTNMHRLEQIAVLPLTDAVDDTPLGWTTVAWSPDGTRLAIGGGTYTYSPSGDVEIHNIETGEITLLHNANSSHIKNIAWSPDGTRLAAAGAYGWDAWVWDTSSGAIIFSFEEPAEGSLFVSWMPDGKGLVVTEGCQSFGEGSCHGSHIYLFDMESGEKIGSLEPAADIDQFYPHYPALSPDGRYTLWANYAFRDIRFWMWDTTTNVLQPITTRTGTRTSFLPDKLVWSPDSKRIVTNNRSSEHVYIWDRGLGFIHTLDGSHTGQYGDSYGLVEVKDVIFCADGTCAVSLGYDGVRMWSIVDEEIEYRGENMAFIPMDATALAISPDGIQLTVLKPDTIELWGVPEPSDEPELEPITVDNASRIEEIALFRLPRKVRKLRLYPK